MEVGIKCEPSHAKRISGVKKIQSQSIIECVIRGHVVNGLSDRGANVKKEYNYDLSIVLLGQYVIAQNRMWPVSVPKVIGYIVIGVNALYNVVVVFKNEQLFVHLPIVRVQLLLFYNKIAIQDYVLEIGMWGCGVIALAVYKYGLSTVQLEWIAVVNLNRSCIRPVVQIQAVGHTDREIILKDGAHVPPLVVRGNNRVLYRVHL